MQGETVRVSSIFFAEMFTRTPEKSVDLETTFSEFDKVLSGNCENTPETAPKKVGKLCEREIAESQAADLVSFEDQSGEESQVNSIETRCFSCSVS